MAGVSTAGAMHAIKIKNLRSQILESDLMSVYSDLLVAKQREEKMKLSRKLPFQNEVKAFYDRKSTQISVAVLILTNFLISAIEAQYVYASGIDDDMNTKFRMFEYFFGYAFLLELLINLYGSFFLEFFTSAWNIFDLFIVLTSLLALYMSKLPGISVLRLFRAFRVVRLFKRVKTLRKIMDGIMKSLPGMTFAFAALLLIMGIYAILAVEFWHEKYPIFFGDFLKAMLALLQIMTFDSWCSGIARDIIYEEGAIAGVFFITYVFVAAIVMANVLIALLLDEFLNTEIADDPVTEEELNQMLEKQQEELKKILLGKSVDQTGDPHKGVIAIGPKEKLCCLTDDISLKHNMSFDPDIEMKTPLSPIEKTSGKISSTKPEEYKPVRTNRGSSARNLSESSTTENECRENDLIRRGPGKVTSWDIHHIMYGISRIEQDISAIADTLKLWRAKTGRISTARGGARSLRECNESEEVRFDDFEVQYTLDRENSVRIIDGAKVCTPFDQLISLAGIPATQQ